MTLSVKAQLEGIRNTRDEEGFTLIELMIVVVIIGILAAIAIPIFANQQNAATDATLKSDVRNAATGVATHLTKHPTATNAEILSAPIVLSGANGMQLEGKWDDYKITGYSPSTGSSYCFEAVVGKVQECTVTPSEGEIGEPSTEQSAALQGEMEAIIRAAYDRAVIRMNNGESTGWASSEELYGTQSDGTNVYGTTYINAEYTDTYGDGTVYPAYSRVSGYAEGYTWYADCNSQNSSYGQETCSAYDNSGGN